MWPGFDSRTRCRMWVEFVVGSRPCSERFFFGYSSSPLTSKTSIAKFQFDLESAPYCKSTFDHFVMELWALQIYLFNLSPQKSFDRYVLYKPLFSEFYSIKELRIITT